MDQPKKVIYIDTRGYYAGAPQTAIIQAIDTGFNVVNLAFLVSGNPADIVVEWERLTPDLQNQTMEYVHSKGGVVLVSAGGSTDMPYQTMNGTQYGTLAGQYVVKNQLDGVDFDLEHFVQGLTYGNLNSTQIRQWLIDASQTAKSIMGNDKIVTHAPQGPYFGTIGGGVNPWTLTSGGYSALEKYGGQYIDWYNIQFYNQGVTCYVDYVGLFTNSSSCPPFPGTSVKEIEATGVPLSKIIVGKYVHPNDAGNGWIDPATMGQYFQQANSQLGWNSGVMGWEWYDNVTGAAWIDAIYPSHTSLIDAL